VDRTAWLTICNCVNGMLSKLDRLSTLVCIGTAQVSLLWMKTKSHGQKYSSSGISPFSELFNIVSIFNISLFCLYISSDERKKFKDNARKARCHDYFMRPLFRFKCMNQNGSIKKINKIQTKYKIQNTKIKTKLN
jgi:hypothetical protein